MAMTGAIAGAARSADPTLRRSAQTPAEALARLQEGNSRYVSGTSGSHNYSAEQLLRAEGQKPFAAILSCADSRVAPELIFDAQPGELFVTRDAGNFLSSTATASLEYGVAELAVVSIVVLGHSACGAVSATISVLESGKALPGHLPELTDEIAPAVERVRKDPGSLLDNATASNVRLNVERIAKADPILAPAVASGKVSVVGALYDISTGKVSFLS
jgi:carbonic anhydrase